MRSITLLLLTLLLTGALSAIDWESYNGNFVTGMAEVVNQYLSHEDGPQAHTETFESGLTSNPSATALGLVGFSNQLSFSFSFWANATSVDQTTLTISIEVM